jgi:predicted nucleotidyltransferase
MSLEQIKQTISPILQKYRVEFAGVFGSVARGENTPDSDVDLFIRFEKSPSLVQFIRMENELENSLNKKVDIVVQGTEKEFVKQDIKRDLNVVYGKG